MPAANTSTAAPLHIFKPGQHTAMSGARLAFSETDLQATVAAYDPALHEAPLVVGHPKHDMPAYGWVKSLRFSEGDDDLPAGMYALPAQVNPDFADMVAAGAFKKISASFYSPDSPSNPAPGVFYLRHVGFLGAQPPAVKGLRGPSFADGEEGVVEFSEWSDTDNAALWRALREWFIGQHGLDQADAVIPSYRVQSLERGADAQLQAAMAAPAPAFSDPLSSTHPQESTVTEEEAALLRQQNEEMRLRLAQMDAQHAEQHRAAIHADNQAFAEQLVSQARLLPAAVPAIVATLDHLAQAEEPVEFGEGDARAPLVQALRKALEAAPQNVAFGETATRDRAAGAGGETTAQDHDFAEADPDRLAQHKAIQTYAANNKVSYAAAAAAVLK